MNIDLNAEQLAELERIARNAGKPVNQILVETAQLLIDFAGKLQPANSAGSQNFLAEKDMEARLASILQH